MNIGKEQLKRLLTKDGALWVLYVVLRDLNLTCLLNDEQYTRLVYRVHMGERLNLAHPKKYNEKVQWLKLYDHNPLYTTIVDKFAVKDYIRNIIGEEYVFKTLAVWEKFDDIDFDMLPNQFVLKTTHGGGNSGVVICKDKVSFDINAARVKLNKSLKQDAYMTSREWPYKNVPRRIIAEEYMEDKRTGELRDYKFFCFDGEPKALFVASERQKRSEPCFDFFDTGYHHLDLRCSHPLADVTPEKPGSFEEMLKLARKLSQGFPHVRVDLYDINGRPYFGELTLYHWEGLMPFYPESWNDTFGSWLKLPEYETK